MVKIYLNVIQLNLKPLLFLHGSSGHTIGKWGQIHEGKRLKGQPAFELYLKSSVSQ